MGTLLLNMMTKVLLDTDIGTDIDDCACLAYLLAEPRCELLGITTVTGEPEKRAQIASALCHVANRDDIPIYPGAAEPLLIPQQQKTVPQYEAVKTWDRKTTFPAGEAVLFLRQTIRQHPGEVTLLTIGPLTNVALLFALDPEIPQLLGGVVTMGGVFGPLPSYGETEWNLSGDPHASALVYGRSPRTHRSVSLEVTAALWMDAATLDQRFTSRMLKAVRTIGRSSVERYGGIVFHDPLAAATLFDPGLCSFDQGNVVVDTCGATPGKSRFTPAPDGSHTIATTVNVTRFFETYFSVFPDAGAKGERAEEADRP